jgi:hypothetical protein
MSLLLPDGVESLHDLPYTIQEAVTMALFFLSFEELPSDETPPKSIWFNGKELKKWWKAVKRKRRQEAGLKDDDMDKDIDGPVEYNEAVKDLIQ